MNEELLPEWLHLYLDDFETILSLVIIILIFVCTAQFVFNQLFDIARTIYLGVKNLEKDYGIFKLEPMKRIRGILERLGLLKPQAKIINVDSCKGLSQGDNANCDDEWDYCDDDCGDD